MIAIEKKTIKNGKIRYYIFNGSRKVMISKNEANTMICEGKAEYGKLFY